MDAEKSSNSSFEDLSNLNEPAPHVDNEGNLVNMANLDHQNRNLLQNSPSSDTLKTVTQNFIGNESGGEATRLTSGDDNQKHQQQPIVNLLESETQKQNTAAATAADSSQTITTSTQSSLNDLKVSDDTAEPDEMTCDILGNGQLVKVILVKSDSTERPRRGDLVTINYVGKLKDGTIVEKAENFQLHVGDYEVVQGLDMAIPLMNLKEKASVTVDARFAYGSLGLKNEKEPEKSVPPGEKITYEVELLDIKEEDYSDLKSFEVRRKYGTRKKERANFWYNRCEYNLAIQLYRRALDYLDDRDGDPDAAFDKEDIELSNSDLQTLLDDRLIVYNNMAMAQIKISAFDAALKSVETVLRCQPNNSKALYRKGRILEGKSDVKGAISLLQKAATLEPENRVIQQDLAKLLIKARREEHNEKKLYQKMLGQAKKLEQKNKQPEKHDADSQNSCGQWLRYLMGSVLVGVAGVALYRYFF